jgi:hypothetical protein
MKGAFGAIKHVVKRFQDLRFMQRKTRVSYSDAVAGALSDR